MIDSLRSVDPNGIGVLVLALLLTLLSFVSTLRNMSGGAEPPDSNKENGNE